MSHVEPCIFCAYLMNEGMSLPTRTTVTGTIGHYVLYDHRTKCRECSAADSFRECAEQAVSREVLDDGFGLYHALDEKDKLALRHEVRTRLRGHDSWLRRAVPALALEHEATISHHHGELTVPVVGHIDLVLTDESMWDYKFPRSNSDHFDAAYRVQLGGYSLLWRSTGGRPVNKAALLKLLPDRCVEVPLLDSPAAIVKAEADFIAAADKLIDFYARVHDHPAEVAGSLPCYTDSCNGRFEAQAGISSRQMCLCGKACALFRNRYAEAPNSRFVDPLEAWVLRKPTTYGRFSDG